jgi:hypothetical protein
MLFQFFQNLQVFLKLSTPLRALSISQPLVNRSLPPATIRIIDCTRNPFSSLLFHSNAIMASGHSDELGSTASNRAVLGNECFTDDPWTGFKWLLLACIWYFDS